MTPSGRAWPMGLATVLGLTVAGNLWVMRVASADPSFAIEPDYYRKAVEWDSTVARDQRSTALGWRLRVVDMRITAEGAARLTVELLDRRGAPIDDAMMTVAATHNARADRVVSATLVPDGGGHYLADLAGARPGIWELRLGATRGAEQYSVRLRHDTVQRPTPP